MPRKQRHTRRIIEVIESSDKVYGGAWIAVFQSRTDGVIFIYTKEQHPRLIAHTMPDGLIFWHEATGEAHKRPYRRLQDDILFWQNFDQAHIREWLGRGCLTSKEQFAGIAEEIYNAINSVRSERAHRAENE